MAYASRESKIILKDGLISYVRAFGGTVSLAKLANKSGYRIENLCSAIDVSPRHFRRLFDTSLGICPKKWLKSERMVYARNLLRSGLSIKEISEELGFCNQKEFYREFKEFYGLSPSDFRVQEIDRVTRKLT